MFFVLVFPLTALSKTDSLFRVLDQVIEQKEYFEREKESQIRVFKRQLNALDSSDLKKRFAVIENLHQAYFTFNYDSAVFYSHKLLDVANRIDKEGLIHSAQLRMSETLLASGLFAVVKDSLEKLSSDSLTDSLRVKYHYLNARLYIDMGNYYQRPFYSEKFSHLISAHLDSAIFYVEKDSHMYYSLSGLRYVWRNKYQEAKEVFGKLFADFEIEGRQFAVDASTFAFVFRTLGEQQKEMEWLLMAAISDIRMANKETVALRIIANELFEQGEIKKASHYLSVAIEDAKSYGAIQRELQISQVQPLVEAAKMDLIEQQKSRIQTFATAVSVLSVLIIVILALLLRQYRKIKKVKDELDISNHALSEINAKLREVNLIKEEYIAFFFKTNSDLIEKLDEYRQAIDNKLAMNKIQQVGSVITRADIKRERETLFRDFDTGFLNIFPDFIERFNALFNEEDRELPDNSKQLNPDLRIFALIRLGISDKEKLAHILNYSVNTINTYKTRIKNKSIVSNEDFEKEILKIQSI
jgi:tetratricopeptide (TPR) repeat protein